jgi:hypothetical protein
MIGYKDRRFLGPLKVPRRSSLVLSSLFDSFSVATMGYIQEMERFALHMLEDLRVTFVFSLYSSGLLIDAPSPRIAAQPVKKTSSTA